MLPILDISPDFVYPGLGLTIKELTNNFKRNLNNQEIWEYKAIFGDFL